MLSPPYFGKIDVIELAARIIAEASAKWLIPLKFQGILL
jgi:hypothetical protein